MPPVTAQNAPPSTLADVIGQVVDAFDAMGNATPIMVGKKYLESFGTGAPPRVLFVPEPKGKCGPPIEMGSAASVVHSCNVYVRGAESGDDIQRFRDAYALGDLVIDCVQTAAPGRVEFGEYSDESPTDDDAFGADLVLSFLYARDVRHSAARWALAPATADTSAQYPAVPPGVPGTVDTFTVATTPKEGV